MSKGRKYSAGALIKRLFSYMGDNRKLVVLSVILLVVGSFVLTLAPMKSGDVLDYLSACMGDGTPIDMGHVLFALLMIAVLYIFGYGTKILSSKWMLKVSRDVSHNFRRALHNKLHSLPINYIDTHPRGDITARLTNDMTTMETMVETDVVNLLANVIILVSILIMMVVINAKLALVYIALMPITFLLMKFITRVSRNGFKVQQSSVGRLNGFMGDIISNHSLIRAYNLESQSKERFVDIDGDFHRAYVKAKLTSGLITPLSTVINNIGYICTVVFGAFLIMENELTIGGFLAYLLYGQMVREPLNSTSTSLGQIQSGLSSLERLFEFLDSEDEPDETGKKGLDVSKVRGEVRFDDVVFGYTPERTLFDGVSFVAEPGTVNAIVGPSGAGKTTIINLLMRFYEIQGGTISLDGEDTKTIARNDLRKAFGMVLQESWVFGGTIAENIGYGKEGATMDEIREVARIVGCDTFIEALPNGYDTVISEENSCISVGEKQLLVLARTLLSDPSILILDEATSNMDARTEALVTKAMEDMMVGKTTFIIAHRLFTIRNADKIIFMRDGGIREVGSHDELMALDGQYADMYRSMSS